MPAHIHAELMKQYAEDAMTTDKPWELWEFLDEPIAGTWCALYKHPEWAQTVQYRRKPRTININGHEVPEPMRVKPRLGAQYWFPCWSMSENEVVDWSVWTGDAGDLMRLSAGLCHSTIEAAEAHAKALLSFTSKE